MQITAPASTCATSWRERQSAPAWLGTPSWLMGFPVKVSALGSPQSHARCLCGPYFQIWELQRHQSDLGLAGGSPALLHRHLLKHSVVLPAEVEVSLGCCFFPLTLQAFFQPFLFPLRFLPRLCVTAVAMQHSGWEQEQWAGHLCCAGAPSRHSSALVSALLASSSSCLGNLSSGRLHS